jgi:glycosyltransferase involved in cell wall biosynthesis
MIVRDLSLCMIVKNEECTLLHCLDSVRSLAPELIVIDTGSGDQTLRLAAAHGAKVSAFDFTFVDFAAARNHALSLATGRWVLVLDADETLHSASIPVIKDLAARHENAGYYFERLNYETGSADPRKDYVVRLFPNRPEYRYRGRVHETVDAAILAGGGRLLRSEIRLDHAFASDPEARRRKNLRYIAILKEEIAADPSDHSRLVFLAAEYHQLGMFEEAARVAERLAMERPLDPQAHLHAGVYHLLYTKDCRQSRCDLLEALRLRPNYPEAQSFLGILEQQECNGLTPSCETPGFETVTVRDLPRILRQPVS